MRIIQRFFTYTLFLAMGTMPLHANPPDWESPTNLQYNMQVVALLELPDGSYSQNNSDLLAAFVGDECRGVASPIETADGRIFLTIGSNEISGEQLHFKAYLAESGQIAELNESFVFEDQLGIGDYIDPFLFTIDFLHPPAVYIISASAGDNGNIAPDGNIEVVHGSSAAFTFSPEPDYEVYKVYINGESIGQVESYEFINVTTDQSIHVTFALPAFLADKIRQEVDFEAYPNPFIRDLTFEIESTRSQDKNLYLQITDNTGHILIAQTIKKSPLRISLANYPSGHYFMHLFENERLIGTKKIIKVNY